MLEFARKIKPKRFFQISTDEVYGEAPPLPSPGHKEWATITPNNPYAASKAAQEALAIAYWRTYDVPVVITNCMNIIGEWQDPEKFLPKIIQSVARGREVPIYADPQYGASPDDPAKWSIGSRVYLDARNKADALKFLTTIPVVRYGGFGGNNQQPDRYNICGDIELNNLQLAQKVAEIMGKPLNYKMISSESARPGYDRRYALDNSKLKALGWQEPIAFEDTLRRIIFWTLQNEQWLI
jgi:dTDP-glucose 4,6-dehydratase